jgi:hypothetical protein
MPEIKKSTIIILTIAILAVSMVLGVEGVFSSSDLDFICDTDNSILYRTAGQWICTSLPAGSAEATTTALGTVKVINCTGTDKLSGYSATNVPVCTTDSGTGTVTSLTSSGGITLNPTTITSTGVIMVSNATTTQAGAVRVLNCSGNGHISGYDSDMNPFCSENNGNGTVTSISQGTGLSFTANPLITTGTIDLAEALTGTIGGVKVANCSVGDFVNGYTASNVPSCATPSVLLTNSFALSDRVLFIRTITNVGATFVDIYLTAFDPENTLINTTNKTGFRIMITMDYVSGAGATESVSFNQTTTNANKLWVFNTTADCDPCDSGWQTIPSWASNIETLVEPQWKSTTAADDPSFKGYQIWLR